MFNFFKKSNLPEKTGPVCYIIAGLGNPGNKYEGTRHNAGFLALDYAAEKLGVKVNRVKYSSLTCEAVIEDKKVLLMKPQTFMNASGTAIAEAVEFYKIKPENIIVICDDINLAPGKMRIRKKGSDGGHNGLKSIIQFIGSENFPRIRLGVGEKPSPEYDLADWVTGKLPENDKKALYSCFEGAYNSLGFIISGDFERAMSLYN